VTSKDIHYNYILIDFYKEGITMKAFVGHSFDDKDMDVVRKIKDFMESLGIKCETGEKPQYSDVSEKVKNRIINNDIFVGIFTHDEKILLENGKSDGEDFYTTSNWVIQESGFAIAKNKKLIFLVEERIYKFPMLQGDQEYIIFNKKSLDKAFIKINNMVLPMIDKASKEIPSETGEKLENIEQSEFELEKNKVKKVNQGKDKKKKVEVLIKLYEAMAKKEDYKEAQKIYKEELKKYLQGDEIVEWWAIVLRNSILCGDPDAFKELEVLANKNKNSVTVFEQIGLAYQQIDEYQKAIIIFSNARKLLDKTKEGDIERIIDFYKQESLCLVLDNKYEEAIKLLSNLLHRDCFKEHKAKILAGLANLAKRKEDIEKFLIYAEGSLNVDPTNTNLRFDLAYRYSKEDEMSLLHYKKLINAIKSPVGLNNLGVQYDILKLPAKSINSFIKSEENKETLAMANIAQRYLNEGFIEDAEREVKRAYELSREGVEVHGNIGIAKNRIEEILEKEEKKEKEILAKAEEERKFRVKYSEAFYCEVGVDKQKIDGTWSTSWGDIKIIFDKEKNSFIGSGEKKLPPNEFLLTLIKNQDGSHREFFTKRLIYIQGNITKLSGNYEIKIEEKDEYSDGTSYGEKKFYKITGYMIINKDINKIEVMEKKNDEDFKIYSWGKVI
jgi:tetratricopeptide (TPR) repeat protein